VAAGSSTLGAQSCRLRDSNAAEGESGLIRISRERGGGSVEGSNMLWLVRTVRGSTGRSVHGWPSCAVRNDQRVMPLRVKTKGLRSSESGDPAGA